MKDEIHRRTKNEARADSEEMRPARGVAFGVLLGAFIWFVATIGVACWRFAG